MTDATKAGCRSSILCVLKHDFISGRAMAAMMRGAMLTLFLLAIVY
jgi:hypothetical protein